MKEARVPKTSDGDVVICVGRESIEKLAADDPVRVGENEYLIRADSYDYPYRRIAELEAALREIAADGEGEPPYRFEMVAIARAALED
jgi:hypothetical protein